MKKMYRILIVGAGELGQSIVHQAKEYDWTGLRLEGFVDDDASKQRCLIDGIAGISMLQENGTSIQHDQRVYITGFKPVE